MHDIIRDTPIYQEILREGREEGREKGREEGIEEGLEKGRIEASRHILLMATQIRFPELVTLAQEQAIRVHDEATLDTIIGKIITAQSENEAFSALRGWDRKFLA